MATKKDYSKSKFLAKEDLPSPRVLTIESVVAEMIQIDDGQDEKPVMQFQEGGVKPWIINSSNWDVIEDAHGDNTDGWPGKQIELYVDPSVKFRGRRVGGIRCRVPATKNASS